PVNVTGTLAPCAPLFGLTLVSVGAGGLTVNGVADVVPPLVVTVTLAAAKVAFAAIVKVAVIWVALATVTLLTATPAFATATVAPARFCLPVNVTGTLAPCAPLFGLTLVRVGAGGLTVNGAAEVVPPLVVTVTFDALKVAFAAIVKVAVIWVALATVTLLTV